MTQSSSQIGLGLEETVRLLLHEPEEQALTHVARLREILMKTVERDLSIRKTDLPSGEAVSPYVAALCLVAEKRTLAFLRGNYAAICHRIETICDRVVYVLDAGCGPLGALSLPLATQFSSDRVRFIATDIHEESIWQIQDTLKKCGLYRHFERFIITDLTSYKHHGKPLDLITSETMGAGLLGEPQAAITANLAPQLERGGIWTPERIVIRAYLATDGGLERYELGEVINMTAANPTEKVSVDFTLPILEENTHLFLGTRIIVYGNHIINEGESSITVPLKVPNGAISSSGNKLYLEYKPGCSKNDIVVLTQHQS